MSRYLRKHLLFIGISILAAACNYDTEPILYGRDICSFCKMTIMDKRFGTEIVTSKGKIFKFDDISCMSKYMKTAEIHEADCKHVAVNSYVNPGEFLSYNQAFFAQTANLQSPMLGNIAAFESETATQSFAKNDSTAKNITWPEIKDLFE